MKETGPSENVQHDRKNARDSMARFRLGYIFSGTSQALVLLEMTVDTFSIEFLRPPPLSLNTACFGQTNTCL